ncbi:Serine/threonine-protein kinase plk4 [Geranomyces michiganensis]|nr:Serine/threonine-protein kinase plk4 [Geranomyces michiganensis]
MLAPTRRPLGPANTQRNSQAPHRVPSPIAARAAPQEIEHEFSFTSPRKASRRFSSKIEDYEIGEMLGRGGFGFVHRAISKSAGTYGREVAIKMIDKRLMKAANMSRRVANEVEVHWQLHHPSILELYNYFEDHSFVYLVMEICQNGELYQYIHHRKCPLTEPEARGVVAQVVRGLLYLHAHGIIHRDLKLSNLLLTENLDVKIADFGLAVKLNELDGEQKTMCGTPNYISPEIVSRLPYGLTSDVWSLGCMVVTLLTGKPPFESKAVKSTLDKVTRVEYTLPANLSPDVRDLVHRLLQKDPKKRLALTKVLSHPFFNPTSPVSSLRPLSAVFDSHLRKKPSVVRESSQVSSLSRGGGTMPREQRAPLEQGGSGGTRGNEEDTRLYSSRGYRNDKENVYEGRRETPPIVVQKSRSPRETPSRTCASDRSRPPPASASSRPGPQLSLPPPRPSSSASSHGFANHSSAPAVGSNNNPASPAFSRNSAASPQVVAPLSSPRATAPSSTPPRPLPTTTPDLPAFSTARLNPLKQKTKHGTVTITPRGDLLLDFFGEEFLMVISCDSAYVRLYDRADVDDDDGGGDPTGWLQQQQPARSYKRSSLPLAYAKKYRYASRFVDLVRSKTPKIIFYSPQAKCVLMENSPQADFEALFYSGTRAHYSASTGIISIKIPKASSDNSSNLTPEAGTSSPPSPEYERHEIRLSAPSGGGGGQNGGATITTDIPTRLGPVVRHVQECFKQCVDVERSGKLSDNNAIDDTATTTFPVILKSSHCRVVATAQLDQYGRPLKREQQQRQEHLQQPQQEGNSFHPSAMSTYTRTVTAAGAAGCDGPRRGRGDNDDDRGGHTRRWEEGNADERGSPCGGGSTMSATAPHARQQQQPSRTDRTTYTTTTTTAAPPSSSSSPRSPSSTPHGAGIPLRATVSDSTLAERRRAGPGGGGNSARYRAASPGSDDNNGSTTAATHTTTNNTNNTTTAAARSAAGYASSSSAAAAGGSTASGNAKAKAAAAVTVSVASLNFHHLSGVGWCVKTADGKFVMLFEDGVRNVVDPRDQTLEFTDGGSGSNDARTTRFTIDKDLPEHAKAKLAFFPQFLRLAGLGTGQQPQQQQQAVAARGGHGRGAAAQSSSSAVGPATYPSHHYREERPSRGSASTTAAAAGRSVRKTASSEVGFGTAATAAAYYRRH